MGFPPIARNGSTILVNLLMIGFIAAVVLAILGTADSVGNEMRANKQKAREIRARTEQASKSLIASGARSEAVEIGSRSNAE